MRFKGILAALVAASVLACGGAEAARTDAYGKMLANGSYTVAYTGTLKTGVDHNRESEWLGWGEKLSAENLPSGIRKLDGMVTRRGDDFYNEYLRGKGNKVCKLVNGYKSCAFIVQKDEEGQEKVVGLDGKKKIEAQAYDPTQKGLMGYDPVLAPLEEALQIIMPVSAKSPGAPAYYPAGSGQAGGLYYEDYRADYLDGIAVARYYFDGARLVKIKLATYFRSGASVDGQKAELNIEEFSDVPRGTKLSLPANVKCKGWEDAK